MNSATQEIQLWALDRGAESAASSVACIPISTPTRIALVHLEPFQNRQRQPRLLASFPEYCAPRVNGEPAARLTVLAPGDQVDWSPDHSYRVALLNRPCIGPPPANLVAKPCPICRVPLTSDTTCVLCACGVAMHHEIDVPDGLQCAQLSRTCPVCHRPIVLTETTVHAPTDED